MADKSSGLDERVELTAWHEGGVQFARDPYLAVVTCCKIIQKQNEIYVHVFRSKRNGKKINANTRRQRKTKAKKGPPKVPDTHKTWQWALMTGAKKLKSGDLLCDQWVYEWDPSRYNNGDNPGYGPCAGLVTNPHGVTIEIQWCDGQKQAIPRKNIRLAAPVGDHVGDQVVTKYTATGVILDDTDSSTGAAPSIPERATRSSGGACQI